MQPSILSLAQFLKRPGPILDVRSPHEFEQGHIPSSVSLPLFTDEERTLIGTIYKKKSRQEAVEIGLCFIEGKIDHLLNRAASLMETSGNVLCWRGGMRSGFTARLLEAAGYTISILQGGYKTYRRWALHRLNQVAPAGHIAQLRIVGGLTGSGKTALLHTLRQKGEQIIDLEAIAKHRGSVFGGIGMAPQDSQEQFENELAFQLESLDWTKPVWLEDESRLIGRRHLPHALYQSMRKAPLFVIERPMEDRLTFLLDQYVNASTEQLIEAAGRLTKRLGSLLANEIRFLLENGNRRLAFEKLLSYYDKAYGHQLSNRKGQTVLTISENDPCGHWACALQHLNEHHS